ncbi:MAG: 50S ribosomal protein L21 [Chloroflexi bacterium]|nr:50S ribosomal protein L21 [Chloroflexota bacterium]
MKYAILEAGGKQYLAEEGETIDVDRFPSEVGDNVQWKDVLLFVDDGKVSVGNPIVKGATVKGKLVEKVKARKLLVFKYKTRERYRRRIGHRQKYSRVMIEKISLRVPPKKTADADKEKRASSAKPKAKAEKKSSTKKKKDA